jgi:hypothetical protein
MLFPIHKPPDLSPGELIEITWLGEPPAYIIRVGPTGDLMEGFYAHPGMIGIWVGTEMVDLGFDVVECDVFLHNSMRYTLLNGEIKRVDDRPAE